MKHKYNITEFDFMNYDNHCTCVECTGPTSIEKVISFGLEVLSAIHSIRKWFKT